MFSSEDTKWETPQWLFDKLDAIYNFDLDPCASPENAKCKWYYTKADNGLKKKWRGNVFMNPPYGREISKWIKKAYRESRKGCTVVALIPARTDTSWWHDYVLRANEIIFIRGRLKFRNPKASKTNSAPFPSAIAVFKKYIENQGK